MRLDRDEIISNGQPLEEENLEISKGLDTEIQLERAKRKLFIRDIVGLLGVIGISVTSSFAIYQRNEAISHEEDAAIARHELKKTKKEKDMALDLFDKLLAKYEKSAKENLENRKKYFETMILFRKAKETALLAKREKLQILKGYKSLSSVSNRIVDIHTDIVKCITKDDDAVTGKCVKQVYAKHYRKNMKGRK